jgi:hypothetical protein
MADQVTVIKLRKNRAKVYCATTIVFQYISWTSKFWITFLIEMVINNKYKTRSFNSRRKCNLSICSLNYSKLPVSYHEDWRGATEDLLMIPNFKYCPSFCSVLRSTTKRSIRHLQIMSLRNWGQPQMLSKIPVEYEPEELSTATKISIIYL